MDFLPAIGSFFAGAGLFLASLFGYYQEEPMVSSALPAATAVFETSLAAPITSSATSMTLASNSVRGGGAVSGYACFTIDEGSSQAEFVCGTVSGTSVTSMTRGVSALTGTTTDADLQFSHRRGASVKITDFPLIQIIKAQNNGEDVFENPLHYSSAIATATLAANRNFIPSVGLVQDIAFSGAGVISATNAATGVVELATAAEAAASTANGSAGPLVLPASIATSTRNSATASGVVPITNGSGLIAPEFIFNGVSLTFPSSQGGASTTPVNNGSGTVAWTSFPYLVMATTTGLGEITGSNASTSMFSTTIPAGVLGANSVMELTLDIARLKPSTDEVDNINLEVAFGTATTSMVIQKESATGNTGNTSGELVFKVYGAGSTSSQKNFFKLETSGDVSYSANPGLIGGLATSTSAIDTTAAQKLQVIAKFNDGSPTNQYFWINSARVEIWR